jgi:hypothetical protein
MSFDSLTFLIFFTALLGLDRLVEGRARRVLLLAASWLFYAGWNPFFLPMLIATASLDWWLARRIQGSASKRPWLMLSLISNLGVLAFFKYRFFIAGNIDELFGTGWLAALQAPGSHQWALPVGISFYTFQSLSYCIDAYRGQLVCLGKRANNFAGARELVGFFALRGFLSAIGRRADRAFYGFLSAAGKSAARQRTCDWQWLPANADWLDTEDGAGGRHFCAGGGSNFRSQPGAQCRPSLERHAGI